MMCELSMGPGITGGSAAGFRKSVDDNVVATVSPPLLLRGSVDDEDFTACPGRRDFSPPEESFKGNL